MRVLNMAEHGTFLGSRFTAREVRERLAAALSSSEPVMIDFAGVQSVGDSFLDEMLGMLIVRQGAAILRQLVFANCTSSIQEAIRFSVEEALATGEDLVFR